MSQAVAVAEPIKGGKGGKLFGGALTDEALDSSRSVLGATHFGNTRGLQQFYSPPEVAAFIKQAIDPLGRLPVLDPTAGNGALLAAWPSNQRFGVEIDGDQVLSSRKPVTVYVMLTKGSLDEKKWALLSAKAAAADLALDGQLMDEREEPISLEQVLKELQAKGVPLTGEEIAESELQAAWENTSNVIPFVPQPKPMAPIEPLGETEQLELFAA
ncbi:MAG: hypothetical protein WB998_07810 [Solirubrobacteraceae bacterium]